MNYNNGQSGVFLSAFYAKQPRLMALAIQQGQSLPSLAKNVFKAGKANNNETDKETSETTTDNKKLATLSKACNFS